MIRYQGDGIYVEIDDAETMRRLINNRQVALFTASEWSRYFAKYTPMQQGILRSNIDIEPWKVIYKSPYAHYQWTGILYVSLTTGSSWARLNEIKIPTNKHLNYSAEQNPLATDHWEVPAYRAFKRQVANAISAYIRRGGRY